SRTHGIMNFPANFMLVAALNPCPCGYYGSAEKECSCSPFQIRKYLSKISGPLLDRLDIHLEVPALKVSEIVQDWPQDGQVSADIRKRVEQAREIQKERLLPFGIYTNSRMNSKMIRKFCPVSADAKSILKKAIEKLGLSARSYDKILKVARTIADLAGCSELKVEHISEAIQYRCLDRLI
ncbi:MAG: ATP-binding protein, partial [Elusimicrobiota bacterium]